MTFWDHFNGANAEPGAFSTEFTIPANTLRNAEISLAIGGQEREFNRWCWAEGVAKINAVSDDSSDVGHTTDTLFARGNGRRFAT